MMPSIHRVTLRFEENILNPEGIVCLSGFGALCRRGCGVVDCAWDHPAEGCRHCEDLCACDCIVSEDGDECLCPIKVEHDGSCPHAYRDLGECWLIPWVHEDEGGWFMDNPAYPTILETVGIRMDGEEKDWGHPVETWELTYSGYDGEFEVGWWPDKPDLRTLRRVDG